MRQKPSPPIRKAIFVNPFVVRSFFRQRNTTFVLLGSSERSRALRRDRCYIESEFAEILEMDYESCMRLRTRRNEHSTLGKTIKTKKEREREIPGQFCPNSSRLP